MTGCGAGQPGLSREETRTLATRTTLKRTVLDRGRHWPTVTLSPTSTRKAGEQWAARLRWRFSYREYFGMKCCRSRREES